MSNRIGLPRNQRVYVVEESVKGTLEQPTVDDLIIAAGFASVNQKPTYTNSEEIVSSRDIINRFKDMQGPGDWSIPMYARPATSLGSKPLGAVLYKSLMGVETVNAGTSVVYSQALTKPSISIWLLKDHTMFFCNGGVSGSLRTGLSKNGAVKCDFSGQFMSMGWVGTDYAQAAVSAGDTDVTVQDARLFSVGGFINLGSDDNNGNGYEVTNINETTNVVTFTPSAVTGCSSGDTISPWEPSGSSTIPASEPIEQCGSEAQIDSVTVPVQSFDLTIDDAPRFLDDEITSACAPLDYVETVRNITGSLSVYFRQQDVKYFKAGADGVQYDVKLIAGDTTGNKMTIDMPQSVLDVPDIQDADNTVALNMGLTALGSSGEDSCTITFS